MNYLIRTATILLLVASFKAQALSPYFSIRSQGENAARELVGLTNHINLYNVDEIYGTGSVTTEYTKSFHSLDITRCLFGKDLLGTHENCRSITISGSGVEDRDATKDWLADYFGLPRDYYSTISFCPRIENVITDFNFYIGFDNWIHGLFFKIHIPVTYTKWNLNFVENISNPGFANHQPGYFNGRVTLGTVQTIGSLNSYPNAYGVSRNNLVSTFSSFICDSATPNLGNKKESVNLPDGTTSGLVPANFPPVFFDPLCKARFSSNDCNNISKFGVADIQFSLGWNALQSNNHHLGFGLRVSAPTGNAPKGDIVFEPILGNGNHWGFGACLTSHATLWKDKQEHQSLNFFCDANITHLFKTKQKRTFDLKNKPNSRYMLAQKMVSPSQNLAGSTTAGANPLVTANPVAQFANQFTPLANLTTLAVDVSISAQADIVFMLAYKRGDFIWDLGYNLWVRGCEKIKLSCDCPTTFADGKTWVLKGDDQVYGYASPLLTNGNAFGQPLSSSQSNATIHSGTNGYTGLDTSSGSLSLRPTQNPGIDNALYAVNSGVQSQIFLDNPNTAGTPSTIGLQVKTSVDPIFIKESDIDITNAQTSGLSHKLFTNIMYTWVEYKDNWDPYLGIGAEGEFHPITNDCAIDCRDSAVVIENPCKTTCDRCGISQWGVWIKGGISFY